MLQRGDEVAFFPMVMWWTEIVLLKRFYISRIILVKHLVMLCCLMAVGSRGWLEVVGGGIGCSLG
jgi:hypothetical protein